MIWRVLLLRGLNSPWPMPPLVVARDTLEYRSIICEMPSSCVDRERVRAAVEHTGPAEAHDGHTARTLKRVLPYSTAGQTLLTLRVATDQVFVAAHGRQVVASVFVGAKHCPWARARATQDRRRTLCSHFILQFVLVAECRVLVRIVHVILQTKQKR